MSLATLFGKLQEHKMELMRLNQHEENDKKKKGIALKVSFQPKKEVIRRIRLKYSKMMILVYL